MMTINHIAETLDVPKTQVYGLMKLLKERDLVQEVGVDETHTGRGRRPTLYEFSPALEEGLADLAAQLIAAATLVDDWNEDDDPSADEVEAADDGTDEEQ